MSTERESGAATDGRALKGKTGLTRLANALRYSIEGLRAAWQSEDAFRHEVRLACVMIPLAAWLPLPLVERILLISVVVLVLITELMNTALEAAVDRDSFEINPLGKRAKDLGSASVFLSLLLAGGTWVAVLLARFVF